MWKRHWCMPLWPNLPWASSLFPMLSSPRGLWPSAAWGKQRWTWAASPFSARSQEEWVPTAAAHTLPNPPHVPDHCAVTWHVRDTLRSVCAASSRTPGRERVPGRLAEFARATPCSLSVVLMSPAGDLIESSTTARECATGRWVRPGRSTCCQQGACGVATKLMHVVLHGKRWLCYRCWQMSFSPSRWSTLWSLWNPPHQQYLLRSVANPVVGGRERG